MNWTRGDEMIVARVMRQLGYSLERRRDETGERVRSWVKKHAEMVCPDRPKLDQPQIGEVGT